MRHAIGLKRALVAGVCLLALGGIAASGAAEKAATTLKGKDPGGTALIEVGAKPHGFTLTDLDGKGVDLNQYLGQKAVLLTFWSLFCGPCREEIPLLDESLKKFGSQGLEMLAINLDGQGREKPVKGYMRSNKFSFKVVWEKIEGTRLATADAYGVAGTPTLVLIGKNGKVSWTHVGRVEASVVESEIKKALEAGS